MADSPDYAKWIREALDADPNLSRAGLSRHLGHGGDRSRVIKMIDGSRRIQVDEIAQIASYLGVPPPGMKVTTETATIASIEFAGAIAAGFWHEPRAKRAMKTPTAVPPRIDPRYPASQQIAYEMADDVPAANLLAGDCLVCMPFRSVRKEPLPADLIVVLRERSGLEQFGLARAEAMKHDVSLKVLTGTGSDVGKPVAIVIGVFRPVG